MNSHINDMFCLQIMIYQIIMASICTLPYLQMVIRYVLIFLTDYVYFPKHTSPIHQQRLNIYHWHPLAEYNASAMNYLWAKYWSIIPPWQGLQILQIFLLSAIIYDFWDLYKTDKTGIKFVSYHISCIMYISEIWFNLS